MTQPPTQEREEEQGLVHAPSKTNPQTPADVLRAAADLIEPEGAWTQGYWARTSSGFATDPYLEAASCYCALGAIANVTGITQLGKVHTLAPTDALCRAVGDVAMWNDKRSRTQAEVVAKLREIAAMLDGEGNGTARHTENGGAA